VILSLVVSCAVYILSLTGCSGGSTANTGSSSTPPVVPLSIVTQPQSQVVPLNGSASLTVVASGTGPLTYQWTLNGTVISGATSASLQFNPITPLQGGNYTVMVSNASGSIASNPAAITIGLPSACDTTNASCPLIYTVPAELGTGLDAANITGQRFGSDVKVYGELVDNTGALVPGSIQSLTLLYPTVPAPTFPVNTALLQVQAPADASTRQLLAIWVERVANGVIYDSAAMYVNKPTINKVSEETVRPGGQMYIWGRWLSQSDTTFTNTSVIFRGASGDIPATIQKGDTLQLEVNVPTSLVTGSTYSLVVSNGWGGTAGQTTFGDAITAGTSGADTLGLGVYWGANFGFITSATTYDVTASPALSLHAKGDGVTDDTAAVQAALTYVGTHGGGVVYAPVGTYKMTSELQILYPDTVLQGAGPSTVFNYGSGQTATTTAGFIAFAAADVTLSGISQMTVNDVFPGTSTTSNGVVRIFSGKANISKLFMANVVFNLNQSYGFVLGNAVSDIVITGCKITQLRNTNNPVGTADNGPMSAGTPYLTFTNNTVNYEEGRLHFTNTNHQIVMGNTFTVDGSVANLTNLATNQLETGGVEFSFSDDVAYIGNTFQVSPAPVFATLPSSTYDFVYTCFEQLLSQYSIYGLSVMGTVTSANGAVITDTNQNWTTGAAGSLTPKPATRTAYMAITDGPGAGQIRTIASYTNNTVTLTSPFDVEPTPGASSYLISYFVNNVFVAQDNTLSNGQVGIEVSGGGNGSYIRRNTVYGGQGIRLFGADVAECGGGTGCPTSFYYARALAWHSDILNNVVDNEDAPAVGNMPIGIWVQAIQFENYGSLNQGLHGNTIFDVEVRNNSVTAHTPNVPSDEHNNTDGWYVIGAWGSNQIDASSQNPYPAYPLQSLLGVIVSNNQTKNATSSAPLKVTTYGVLGIVDSQAF